MFIRQINETGTSNKLDGSCHLGNLLLGGSVYFLKKLQHRGKDYSLFGCRVFLFVCSFKPSNGSQCTFRKNVLVFIMVLHQLIMKVCYTLFVSRHFVERHAGVYRFNFVYQCESQLKGRVIFSRSVCGC